MKTISLSKILNRDEFITLQYRIYGDECSNELIESIVEAAMNAEITVSDNFIKRNVN